MAAPTQLIWALIGLILTVGGTLLEAFITSPPWGWSQHGIQVYSLGVTSQVAAVLLIGCLGGSSAAAISQVAYLILGLTWFNVFTQGGGLDYLHRPAFGYSAGVCAWSLDLRLAGLSVSAQARVLGAELSDGASDDSSDGA